jgi:hypothetical protein
LCFARAKENSAEDVVNKESISLARIRHDAELIIIRLGLGVYELKGPDRNVLKPESRVVWATVASELAGEGYVMVTLEEYANASNVAVNEILARVWEEGKLFALVFGQEEELLLPLPEKKRVFHEMEGN